MKRASATFTLTELLVVIAVIGILASFLMPALSKSLGIARHMHCTNNLRQAAIAFLQYADDNHGWLPPNKAGEVWAARGKIAGITSDLTAWWQILYYQEYIKAAKILSDPVTNAPFYLTSSSMDNLNCSYGLSGLGTAYDSSLLKIQMFKSPSRCIGLVERTDATGFSTTTPLRHNWGCQNPVSAGALLGNGNYIPHNGMFTIQLYDGHVEQKMATDLAVHAPRPYANFGVKYISSFYSGDAVCAGFQKPAGYATGF